MSVKRVFFGVLQKIMVICCAIFLGFANAFAANLPSGYTELEYIESTGTQYIDTGIIGNNNKKFDISFQNTAGTGMIFGSRSSASSNAFAVWTSSASLSSSLRFGFDGTGGYTGEAPLTDRISLSFDGEQLYRDGVVAWTKPSVASFTTPSNLLLFAYYNKDNITYAQVKVFVLKLYDNNALVRNFIPAKRNSDGEVGMYDTVNNVFYQNAGTGTFTAGPVVLNPCRNLFDKDAMIHGAYIGASGTETYSAQYCYSNYIPVTPGQTYTFSAVRNLSGSNKRIHAYDSNKNWIQQLGLSSSSSSVGPYDITVTIPSGISYILISGMKCDVDGVDTNMQFEQGSTATAYVPYNASCHNPNLIKIATTAYNAARFNPVVTDLNSTIATIRSVVTNTINQTKAIADLQAKKQTRPDEQCPAGKKCLLVETEENGVVVPHWFPIIETPE